VARQRNSRDFLLVSSVSDSRPVRHERASIAVAIMFGMVAAASLEPYTGFSMFGAALVAAAAMGVTRCLSAEQARRSIDVPTLLSIMGALVIGRAMEGTGLAGAVAGVMIDAVQGLGPWAVLAGVYALTLVFTELVTNNAAAALAFPVAHAAAAGLSVSPLPFAVVIAVAASAGFASPIGYQTHLMVYGAGGYRFGDFVRLGLGLDLLVMAVTLALTPLLYPFAAR
jgi:di/tricarboxylate transporter